MTCITLQGDMAVIRDGKVGTERRCCCCTPCERCSYGCLNLTLSGLRGPGGSECDECVSLNGTYTLVRGGGVQPSIFVEAQSSSGTGAVLTATLDFSKSKGTYSVGKITIEKAGSGYNQDVTLAYTVVDGIVACNDPPVLSAIAEPLELFIDQTTIRYTTTVRRTLDLSLSIRQTDPDQLPTLGKTWRLCQIQLAP